MILSSSQGRGVTSGLSQRTNTMPISSEAERDDHIPYRLISLTWLLRKMLEQIIKQSMCSQPEGGKAWGA